jgi:hypothetical protein
MCLCYALSGTRKTDVFMWFVAKKLKLRTILNLYASLIILKWFSCQPHEALFPEHSREPNNVI